MHLPMTRPLTLDLGDPSFLNRIFGGKPAGLAPKDALCIICRLGASKWRLKELVGLVAALHASIEQRGERNLGKDSSGKSQALDFARQYLPCQNNVALLWLL